MPAIRGGVLGLAHEDGAWRSTVHDYLTVRPVPAGDPDLLPLPVHVEGRGPTAPEQPAQICFVGGGPIQSGRIARFHDAFGAEMRRLESVTGQEWWQDAGVRICDIQVRYQTEESRVHGRRRGERLLIWVDRSDESLPSGDPAPLARHVAEEVVTLVRRRTGLGPHPELGR